MEARDVAKQPTMHRPALTTKKHASQMPIALLLRNFAVTPKMGSEAADLDRRLVLLLIRAR